MSASSYYDIFSLHRFAGGGGEWVYLKRDSWIKVV